MKKKISTKSKREVKKKSKIEYPLKSISLKNYLKDVPHFFWKDTNTELLAIGTAHVSKKSIMDVKTVFQKYTPNIVGVELCAPRYESMISPDRWKKLELQQIIKQKKIWLLTSTIILNIFQKKIGEGTGVMPGAEMKLATELANTKHIKLILIDRNVQVTLSRAWGQIGFFSRFWLFSFLLTSIFINEKVEEEEIEELKKSDALEELIRVLPKKYHPLKNVILDERDICIAELIKRNILSEENKHIKKKKILVVLGAAHLKGVKRQLLSKKKVDLENLFTIPQKRSLRTIVSYLFFSFLFLAFSSLIFRGDLSWNQIQEMTMAWVACRCLGAGLGVLLARSSFSTFLITILFAPISYFLSFIGLRLWMITALAELRTKKPQVKDFENISADTKDFKTLTQSLYTNRVLHLLFLIMASSLGLTIGNLFFFKILLTGVLKLF